MSVIARDGGDTPFVAWRDGWPAWRQRERLADHVHFIDSDTHTAEIPADGVIQTTGPASGCFACASHPGRVYRPAPNGEGLVPAPCPACRRDNEPEVA